MAATNLSASKREDVGNSSVKTSRKKGNIPGVLYSKTIKPIPIYVKETVLKTFTHTSEVNIINLKIEGASDSYNCILKDVQFDPVSDRPLHFDLFGISETEKITLEIPLVLVGTPVGIKDGGVIQHTLHKIEVECLPKDIPSHIDVNIESLNIGDSVHISDIKAENFEVLGNPDATIVSVVPPAVEKVETPETVAVEGEEAPAEPEVIAKGKKEETEEEK
jgi:large subunit ribosomal protein L25